MVKPKYLYHGGTKEIVGRLLPRQAQDLGEKPENLYRAVYATNNKEIAIAMAIISCKGVISSSLIFKKRPFGIVYEGWPKQEYVYLYTLPSKNFEKADKNGKQWIAFDPVKPCIIEKLAVEDFIYLVRKATQKEKKDFLEKYKEKLENRDD